MKMRLSWLAVVVIATTPAFGQLHLITGSPTPKYMIEFESALFRVSEDGAVIRVADLVSASTGTEWIGTSEDWRKAVLLPRDGRFDRVVVVDFDKAAVVFRMYIGPPQVRWGIDEKLSIILECAIKILENSDIIRNMLHYIHRKNNIKFISKRKFPFCFIKSYF